MKENTKCRQHKGRFVTTKISKLFAKSISGIKYGQIIVITASKTNTLFSALRKFEFNKRGIEKIIKRYLYIPKDIFRYCQFHMYKKVCILKLFLKEEH